MLSKHQAKIIKVVQIAIFLLVIARYAFELKPIVTEQLEQSQQKNYQTPNEYAGYPYFDNCMDSNSILLKQVATSLRCNQTMVIYAVQKNQLHTTVINAQQILHYKTPLPDSFSKLLSMALKEVKTNGALLNTNNAIFNFLIKPIQNKLNENVVIIPDPTFASLPIELIKDNNQFLIEKYTICYSCSVALWLKSGIAHNKLLSNSNVLLFAPEFKSPLNTKNEIAASPFRDNNLAALPFSKEEVNGIQSMYTQNGLKNTNYLGHTATENMARKSGNSYSIIHIATHGQSSKSDRSKNGVYFNKPQKESTSSDNGFLSLNEIPNMHLNAEMIVLSACNTGRLIEGRDNKIASIPQYLIQQGVHNVIASVWKVHDEHTKDLMIAFYKHLIEDKCTYAKALQLAKIDCIKRGFLPLDWAAFIVYGNSN